MFEVLKLVHVLGWAAWLGLAVAEASVGVQVRKASEPAARTALGRLWARLGRIQLGAMGAAVLFGLATFAYELATNPLGPHGYMQQRAYLFVHVMLALGLLAAIFSVLAAQKRSAAVGALESGDGEGFTRAYKRASMFSGMMSLCILATVVEVYLRSL